MSTIRWHAFSGSAGLSVPPATRIRSLKSRLQRDLFFLWDSPPPAFLKARKPSSEADLGFKRNFAWITL
jgi:hypothetical protein